MILIPTTLTIATISIIWYHLTGNKRWLRYQRLRIAFKMASNAAYGVSGFQTYQIPPGFDWNFWTWRNQQLQQILRG